MRGLRRRRVRDTTAVQLLDEAYDARLRALERIRAAAGSVHASRARLESSLRSSRAALERHEQQARDALAAGDEHAARAAAARCVPIDADIAATGEELRKYRATEDNLATMRSVVAEQLNSLRKRREAARGSVASAEALEVIRAELAQLGAQFSTVEHELDSRPG